ncbi:MAG TPA: hypothetical protein VGH27_03470 [Streptosporangiaceae bacterium]
MSGGYSYTTITSAPEEPTRIGVSFYLDDAAWIRAVGEERERPQLSIRHGHVDADFAPTLGPITDTDVRIARQLAEQAALYAGLVERLKANQDAREQAGTAA